MPRTHTPPFPPGLARPPPPPLHTPPPPTAPEPNGENARIPSFVRTGKGSCFNFEFLPLPSSSCSRSPSNQHTLGWGDRDFPSLSFLHLTLFRRPRARVWDGTIAAWERDKKEQKKDRQIFNVTTLHPSCMVACSYQHIVMITISLSNFPTTFNYAFIDFILLPHI